LRDVLVAVKTVWPSDRIGVRLSANSASGNMGSADNYEQFTFVMDKLSQHNLAYLAILDGEAWGTHGKGKLVKAFDAKLHFGGVVIANVGYTRDTGEGVLQSGAVNAVAFGRPFLSNPDLVERFQNDWPLNEVPPQDLWYDADKGAEGYTSFGPFSPLEVGAQRFVCGTINSSALLQVSAVPVQYCATVLLKQLFG
jgi:N-ethylmaleimide reductase